MNSQALESDVTDIIPLIVYDSLKCDAKQMLKIIWPFIALLRESINWLKNS
jgi:hypothetical protein